MIRSAITFCYHLLTITVVASATAVSVAGASQMPPSTGLSQRISRGYFTPNIGQWPDSILFRGVSDHLTLWFSRAGVCYQLDEGRATDADASDRTSIGHGQSQRFELVQSRFVSVDTTVRVVGDHQLPFVINFIQGNNSESWKTGVPAYSSIRYLNVTNNIDVEFYFNNGKIEYDVVASSREALARFAIDFPGRTIRPRSGGGIEIPCRYGVVSHETPVTFVVDQGNRSPIASRVLLSDGGSQVQFEIDQTMKISPWQLVVVDPYLSYSSYLGGSGAEDGVGGIEINPLNNHRIVCGTTKSSNFPLGTGGYDAGYNGNQDIFVANFNADGSLASATFVGGGGDDVATGLAIGADEGNIFVCGYSTSSDFPVTPGAFDLSIQNGDGVLFRLNDVATSLIWSTFLGGSNVDQAASIAIRQSSNPKEIVVCGHTSSSNFPTTAGCYDAAIGAAGVLDAFVAKFRADNGNIMFSTYYGGAQEEFCNAIAIGESGGASYIGGKTMSSGSGFPKKNQFDNSFVGASEGFIARIMPLGDSLVWSSWFGGDGDEEVVALDFDNTASRLIVAGTTTSSNLPSTGGGLGGSQDAFYTRINPTTPTIEFSLYLGDLGSEAASDVAVRSNSDVYMTGSIGGTFPNVATCDGGFKGGSSDAFAVVLNSGGSQLFGTNFGGGGNDWGYAIAIDPFGDPIIAGVTASGDIPLSFQSWVDRTWEGGSDCFVARLLMAGSCPDNDGDCICNDVDNCVGISNSSQVDTDGDGMGDLCDSCPLAGDGDNDGIPDCLDPCPGSAADHDLDGLQDGCDPCTDTDGDGFGNPGYPANTCLLDICPLVYNPAQSDADLDGLADDCNDGCIDYDHDGWGEPGLAFNNCQGFDNCPYDSNSNQSDFDQDGIGDACDSCLNSLGPIANKRTTATNNTIRVSIFRELPKCRPIFYDVDEALSSMALGAGCIEFYIALDIVWKPMDGQIPCAYEGSLQDYIRFSVGDFDTVYNYLADTFIVHITCSLKSSSFLQGHYRYLAEDTDSTRTFDVQAPGDLHQYTYTLRIPKSQVVSMNGFERAFEIRHFATLTPVCCENLRGNVDCDPADGVDISDLSAMIDALYLTFSPLCCKEEANVDGFGQVDIGDLSTLIDYLYISFTPLPSCP